MTMTLTLTCYVCSKEIPQGEKFVAVQRHVQQDKRRGSVVTDAELVAAWHQSCAPRRGSALLPI
jgi:hypothetical protein